MLHNTSTLAVPLNALSVAADPLSGMLVAARDKLLSDAAKKGIDIAISFDFFELLEINKAAVAAQTWFPMLPATDPTARHLDRNNGFWIRGTDAAGDVVTVQAASRYDCTTQSIADRLADMTVFYDDPSRRAPVGEWCAVTSPAAAATRGNVVFTCSGWTRPDYQRRGLFALFHRVNRLVCWLLWRPDYLFGLVEAHPKLLAVWSEGAMGPRLLEDQAAVIYTQSGVGELPLHFMRFSRAQVFGDLADLTTTAQAAAAA